ncbi:Cof-type HAD-IIB family hydrolase [Corynebacterium ulcerans]|uniref:Cof-type HAD-IIB family hydrolase n=1 Tax=Corynebacterium ulcerans TaxID=65058 RepID=UPI00051F7393|nr:Cof-type HAD-IIB family hydrolase [Corynebacterium ulcerans]AIT88727.1 Phosphatase [Corynebacterium ulcerans]ALD94503.1 Phosphatase [Corynebacterium ulcerans]SQG58182.1 Cof-like hydrolase family protein [Corynebacterium ulcerans]
MTPRIIATDMDGTLLNHKHEIPESFWPLLERMHEHEIIFAPASGRQLYTLLNQFERSTKQLSVIAENGTVVYHEGSIVSVTTIDRNLAHAVIAMMDTTDLPWGLILCRVDGAFMHKKHKQFLAESIRYYARLEQVDDLHSYVDDTVVKLAIFTEADAESIAAPLIRSAAQELNVVVSGRHWIDVMNPEANKGVALQALAEATGTHMSDTLAFGDFLNDLELLQAAGTSYAMDNAHPTIKSISDAVAPSHADEGVIHVVSGILDALEARTPSA